MKKRNFLIIMLILNILLAMPQTWFLGLKMGKKIIKNDVVIEKIEKKINNFNEYQFSSEGLVLGRIITDKINSENKGKFLVRIESKEITDSKKNFLNTIYYPEIDFLTSSEIEKNWNLKIYNPQFGLQGSFFSFLYNTLNLSNINILCTSFMIIYLLNWIFYEFGFIAMYLSSFSFLISPMFLAMERNLYWMIWIWFLPICITIYIMKNSKRHFSYLVILPFISILIKSLNGYEFISTILINMEIPIIYYCLKRKEKIINLIRICSLVGISGILGFIIAIMLHIKKILCITNDLKSAFNFFLYPIIYRTNLLGYKLPELSETIGENYKIFEKSLNISFVEVLGEYLLNPKIILIIILLILFIIKDLKNQENIPLITAIILSFIGVLSWIILAKGHSYIHTHINPVLWNIPFLMLSFAYFGIKFEKYVLNRRRK